MKPIIVFSTTILLAMALFGCGENSKGPDQQVTPSSTSGVTNQGTPPPDQVAVDKEPTLLKKVEPVYPELALKAGLEGRVVVKIWVGSDGTPKQVVILKSDSDVFNQVSIDAAKQFLFTPAYMKDKPVDVWVSLPFKFKLADKGSPRPEEVSFMKGYIAAKEDALSAMQKEAADAKKGGTANPALDNRIQASKGELQALKDALKAMQAAR